MSILLDTVPPMSDSYSIINMQLSRSQFQGHPLIGAVSLSFLAGASLGTHGQTIID